MTTIQINLPTHEQRFLHEAVQSGRYASEGEVIVDALKNHGEQHKEQEQINEGWRELCIIPLADKRFWMFVVWRLRQSDVREALLITEPVPLPVILF